MTILPQLNIATLLTQFLERKSICSTDRIIAAVNLCNREAVWGHESDKEIEDALLGLLILSLSTMPSSLLMHMTQALHGREEINFDRAHEVIAMFLGRDPRPKEEEGEWQDV